MDGADLRFCVWLLVSSSGGLLVLDCGGEFGCVCIDGVVSCLFCPVVGLS